MQNNQDAIRRVSTLTQVVNSKGRLWFSPISTNSRAGDFEDSGKYANMSNNEAQKCRNYFIDLDVTESVNCPFHYTEGFTIFRTRRSNDCAARR